MSGTHRRTPGRHGSRRPPRGFIRGVCSTGKQSYFTRAGAKALVRAMKAEGDKGVRAYRCPECEHFHAGHMPDVVRRGKKTAGEIYRGHAS